MQRQTLAAGLAFAGLLIAIPILHSKSPQSASLGKESEQTTQEIEANIQRRHSALDRADRRAYAAELDPKAILVAAGEVETGEQRIQGVAPTVGYKNVVEHERPKVTDFGQTAIASYHQNEKEVFGEQFLNHELKVVDTYVKKDGHWVMVAHVAVPELLPRKVAKVDAAGFKQFVGEYQWGPGYVDTVTLLNGKLMTSWTGDEKLAEWLPFNENTFFTKDDTYDALVTFKKDASGKVTHYIYHAFGQEIIARKIK